MKPTTKLLIFVLLALAASARPSAAQSAGGAWCAVLNIGSGIVQERCDFRSFEACRREAQAFGTTSFCRQSNWYAPYWGAGEQRPIRRTKKRHRHDS
jgi:hypothetical protein